MADIKEVIAKIKPVVVGSQPPFGTYHFSNGAVSAFDGTLYVSTPSGIDLDCIVEAAHINRVLAAFPDDGIKIEKKGDDIIFKSGRRRAKVPGLPTLEHWVPVPSDGESISIDDSLFTALEIAEPFTESNSSRLALMGVHFKDGYVEATNSHMLVVVDTDAIPTGTDLILPPDTVKFILYYGAPAKIKFGERSMTFEWDDGTVASSKLIDIQFPDVSQILKSAGKASWKITDAWREAFSFVASLSDWDVYVGPKAIRSGGFGNNTGATETAECPIDDETRWTTRYLKTVLRVATHVDLGPSDGKPVPFRGDGLHGVLAPIK